MLRFTSGTSGHVFRPTVQLQRCLRVRGPGEVAMHEVSTGRDTQCALVEDSYGLEASTQPRRNDRRHRYPPSCAAVMQLILVGSKPSERASVNKL